jgi:hypothetical protein
LSINEKYFMERGVDKTKEVDSKTQETKETKETQGLYRSTTLIEG